MQEFVVNGLKDGQIAKVQVVTKDPEEAGKIAIRDYNFTRITTVVRLTSTSTSNKK